MTTASSTPIPSPTPSVPRADELVLDVVREHAATLLGTARRFSICVDDANDAYQRALEIFVKRAHRLDRESALPWLRTVVKHEALTVRASRVRLLGGGEDDMDARESRETSTPEERAADADLLMRSAEALQRLKPQEARALLLKAHGHTYQEICELTGWTYTKVNRCLTEGRRRFLERYAGIESGAECERWTGVLSALADGEAAPDDLLALRPHLRNCPGCRARLRGFRDAPGALGAVVPLAAVVTGTGAQPRSTNALARVYETAVGSLPDRVLVSAQKFHAGLEAASSGKLAAVAVSATALGGGVAAVDGPPVGRAAVASRPAIVRGASAARPAPQRAMSVAGSSTTGGAEARTVAADAQDLPEDARATDRAPSLARRTPPEGEFDLQAGASTSSASRSGSASAASDDSGAVGGDAMTAETGSGGTTAGGAGGEFGP